MLGQFQILNELISFAGSTPTLHTKKGSPVGAALRLVGLPALNARKPLLRCFAVR
jgi:hypothetical protein